MVLDTGSGEPIGNLQRIDGAVTLLTGPEGGFNATEIELAARAGFMPLSLGPRILRTETAALAAIAILQSLFGDLNSNAD